MTVAVTLGPEFASALARRVAGHGRGSDWLRRTLPGALVHRLFDVDASTSPPIRAVCPFCSETYPEPRDRCSTCGGLPVVAPEDTRVYEAVIAPCGPDCERSTAGRDPAAP